MPKRHLFLTVVLIMFFVVILLPAANAQDNPSKDQLDSIKSYLKDMTDQGNFSGTVLVAHSDDILLNEGYGMANIEWGVPNTPYSKFRIASITKQFTAISILLLQEQGKLKVEDLICAYLKPCPKIWAAITIEELLTHTDGIQELFPNPDPLETQQFFPPDLINMISKKPLLYTPGQTWNYTNSGYIILGQIINSITHQFYPAYLKANILQPLGLENTGYDNPDQIVKNHVTGYVNNTDNAAFINPTTLYSAGALYSTTGDLFKWTRAVFQGKVISSKTLDTMLEKLKSFTKPKGPRYGFELDEMEGHRVLFKNGSFPGYQSILYYFPDDEITVVILSNFETAPVFDMGASIAKSLFGNA